MTDWTPRSGTPAWTELSDQVLASAAASISVTGIASTYRRFAGWCYVVKAGASATIIVRINNDSGANYNFQRAHGDGATAGATRQTGGSAVAISGNAIPVGGTGLLTFEIEKPVAGTRGRIGGQAAVFADLATDAVTVAVADGDWKNTANLISRVDVIASSGTMNVGSRLILEGAP